MHIFKKDYTNRKPKTSVKGTFKRGYKNLRTFVVRPKNLEKNAATQNQDFIVLKREEISPSLLLQAKRLHTEIYLERTFIDQEDIGPEGHMHLKADPHQAHSDYFVVVDRRSPDKVLASARQIRADNTHEQLPILLNAKLKNKSKRALLEENNKRIVEISGLVKAHGTPSVAVLELYLAMWGESMNQRHQTWIMACDVRLYKRLKILFGKSVTRIGRKTHYKGGDIIPCKLELNKSHIKLLKNLNSKQFLYGRARRAMAEKFLRTYTNLNYE